MKYIIITLILFGLITPVTNAQNPKEKVAVYMTGEIENTYKKVIGAKLVSAITATDKYVAVERTDDFLAALSNELDYQTSGAVKDSQIAVIGQQFGVRYVVVADVNELFDEIFIAARIINVETGIVEKAADASSVAENISQIVELSSKITNKLFIGVTRGTQTPTHLTIQASNNDGTFYFTEEQWLKLDTIERESLHPNGICLIKERAVKIYKGIMETTYGRMRQYEIPDYSWTSFIIDNFNSIDRLLQYTNIKRRLAAKRDVIYQGYDYEFNFFEDKKDSYGERILYLFDGTKISVVGKANTISEINEIDEEFNERRVSFYILED